MKLRKLFVATAMLSLALLIGTFAGGCESLKTVAADAQAQIEPTKQSIADVEKQLADLPTDDPARKVLEPQLEKLKEILPKLEKIAAAGQATSLDDPAVHAAAASIPYGSLALALLVAGERGYRAFQRRRQLEAERKALTQVVAGLESMHPHKTPIQKLILGEAQDEQTKQRVAEIKAAIPKPTAVISSPVVIESVNAA